MSKIVNHNYTQLNTNNISTHNIDGIKYLSTTPKSFDWIYADPSRRHNTKGKVFFLKDCLPNIPEYLESLFKNTSNILIKTSPLLDVSIGIKELKCVKTIHIVAVNNDVKELLWILEKDFNDRISVKTVNIKKENKEYFNFKLEDETKAEVKYSLPQTYLYEPNSAILKAGGFNTVSKQFSLYKLHKHSHLYTNNILIDFPGRSFKIEKVIPFNNKALKNANITKANITTRNFSETVQQIRKKFSIKDGGDYYLFFTTDINNERVVIITSKVNKN